MAKILTIQGANNPDELTRLAALEKLNELDTVILTRIAELSEKEAARKYFKSGLLFETVKGFLK